MHKKNLILWGAAVLLVAAAVIVGATRKPESGLTPAAPPVTQSQQEPLISTEAREKAPAFSLTDLSGNSVSMEDLKGKYVYINFWATWCPWCKTELPDIDKITAAYKDKNLIVLTIDIGEDQTTVGDFVKRNGYGFNVLLDTDSSIANLYGVNSIPVSVFVDKDGSIAEKRVGAMTYDQMKGIVDKLLSETE